MEALSSLIISVSVIEGQAAQSLQDRQARGRKSLLCYRFQIPARPFDK